VCHQAKENKELTKRWPYLKKKEDVGNVFVIRLQRVKIVRDGGAGSGSHHLQVRAIQNEVRGGLHGEITESAHVIGISFHPRVFLGG
jgi:hypothetical protein